MPKRHDYDVLIIGSGAAGLSVAIQVADHARVAVVCKGELSDGSTYWAQGGIAAVLDDEDTIDAHVADTLRAGAGLCDERVVRFTVEHSRESIQWLIDLGVEFTKLVTPEGHEDYHLTMEGGHSHRRIIHVADATGRAVSSTLIEAAQRHASVDFFERHIAVNLIVRDGTSQGAYVLDCDSGDVDLFRARHVVLATGGASKVYLYTTNPDTATGDGIAMAWRAGCRIANMEFNQFHPTCLYHPLAKSFLISEAVRGEGGILLLPDGERFMPRFHELAELAPRDIVARAIDHEMKRLGIDCVYLDISHKGEAFIVEHFPTIHARCLELGIDMSAGAIPVVPAAHYTCGGVLIDLDGQTDVSGLYAVGETAFTGLHGANRMASNSLLECFVFARSAAQSILRRLAERNGRPELPDWDASQVTDSDEDVVISHNWDELRRFMWDYVGIVRTTKRLQRAQRRANLLQQEIAEYYSNYKISSDLIELRNLALVADLIIRCALERKESRGLHYTLDYPNLAAIPSDTILTPPASHC
jgi:L-aspartate oxidase